MEKKIIVVGANQGALVFAEFAAKAGFNVTCYEAKKKEDMAYDWTDDMKPEVFAEIGMPLPPKDVFYRKRGWTFVPPNKGSYTYVELPPHERDLSVERKLLNNWLETRAVAAGAKVIYDTPIRRAVVTGARVTGVYLNKTGEKVDADFVLDCGGVNSIVRETLPEKLMIKKFVDKNDTFIVRRTFFNRPDGTARPEFTNKAYLKHISEKGISWCILSEDEKCADILIGRVGEMSDETFDNALADLRAENEIVGNETVKGGQLLQIPVRHPISRMVANGYALLGDSAYMTIPMLGSGIASGMKAAKILVDVLAEPCCGDAFGITNLYRYQQRFMKEIGGKHAAIDLMKNWLLAAKPADVDFLINSGVVSKKILTQGSTGEMVTMNIPELLTAAVKGAKRLPLLLQLAGLLLKMNTAYRTASNMPKSYDDHKFFAWEQKYEKIYR